VNDDDIIGTWKILTAVLANADDLNGDKIASKNLLT